MQDKSEMNRELQEQWERALERASQAQNETQELDTESLRDTVGLHLKSGVKGGWTNSCSCQATACCGT
jgi:hypothetical protein